MRLANLSPEHTAAAMTALPVSSETVRTTNVTPEDVRAMMLYLRKARDRAIAIRDRSPGGSYLESVLTRTIDGIALELSQLDYLLAQKPAVAVPARSCGNRMRPAL
ncbi:hypothetical protein [Roseibium sp.]|uniref:hypothetical protein n=1 Tax=Roseibium sp. TaxID=1936156 RepID=UPI003BAE6F2C